MAVSLRPDDLGRLVDPFGGRADLEARRLRVLHPRSFIDDPTRIFRAVRYENRLGFRMDDETLQLAHDSVETGHVGDLSPARLRDELVALFGEGEVGHTIERIAELGLDEAIHPHLAADAETVELLGRLTALDAEYELGVPAWRLGFAVLAAAAAARGGARLAPQPEAAPPGRGADRGRGHRSARASPSRWARAPRIRPRSSRSPIRTRPTRRSSRSRSPTSSRFATTSAASAGSASR